MGLEFSWPSNKHCDPQIVISVLEVPEDSGRAVDPTTVMIYMNKHPETALIHSCDRLCMS